MNKYMVVYVVGPFENNKEENCKKFKETSIDLWDCGYVVINPIANGKCMKGHFTSDEFRERDIEIVTKVDAIYVQEGWEESVGSKMEIEKANEYGIFLNRLAS